MELIRRADKPKKFEVCLEANLRTKRKEPYKNAFRIQSKSVVVHFYNKQFQMNKVFGDEFPKGQDAKDIIRLEVQCKKRKMNNLKQYYQISGKTLEDFSDQDLSEKVLLSYYRKTVGYEDYFTLKEARELISNSDYKRKYRENMIEVIELINQKRSIWKAREEYDGEIKKFNEAVKQIKKMGINPVTIPAWWKIDRLPNLIHEIDISLRQSITKGSHEADVI